MNSDVSIVYEDQDIVVIDKPSGLITHPKNLFDHSESASGWFLQKYPEAKEIHDEGPQGELRPGVVHRLDRETSGLLVLAKNMKSFSYMKSLFQTKEIRKTYLALVHGHLKQKAGLIDIPLGKIGTLQSTRIHGKKELKEKEAQTEYKLIKQYTDYSLVEVRPLTGRTHQIRLHMKAIGNTVVCDRFYRTKSMVCPVDLGRLFLHAQKISFVSPSGQALSLEADLPPQLEHFLTTLDKN